MSEVEQPVARDHLSDRALLHRAESLVEMSETDAFQLILTDLEAQSEKAKRLLFDEIWVSSAPVDQRTVDSVKGLVEGLSRPALMVKTARDLLRKRDEKLEPVEPVEEEPLW